MRAIHIITTLLGIALITLSLSEVAKVKQYRLVVTQVQAEATRLYRQSLDTLRKAGFSYTIAPSMESVLSELRAGDRLERGWWTVCGIGAAISVAGVVGLLRSECLRRKQTANNALEATAG